MHKYRLFEKTSERSKSAAQSMNGNSPPSPADDPLDRLARVRQQLKSVTDEEEDTGEFDVSKAGIRGKGVPRWAMGAVGVGVSLALVVVAIAYALKLLK